MVTRLKIDPTAFSLEKDGNGPLVRFDDYKELEQRLKGVSSLCEKAMSNEVEWEREMATATGKNSPATVAKEIENLKLSYAALQQNLNAMAAENAALKKSLKGTVEWCYSDDLPETPATDTYLNSVRAEGVEMLAFAHQKIVDSLDGDSLFDDFEREHKNICSAAITFADKLRSGTHDTAENGIEK